MDPVHVLLLAGGAARWSDLRDAGVSRGTLLEAVKEGRVVRPHRGCFALPAARFEDIDATIFRGTVCCASVLRAEGIPVVPYSSATHIMVPDSRSLARPGIRPLDRVVIHRSLRYPEGRMGEIPVALDLASRCLEPAAQLAAIEAAIRAGKARPDVIAGFLDTSEERREWLAARLDLSAESAPETLVRVALRDAGFKVRPQTWFPEVGRVDFEVEDCVFVECDGFRYHSKEGAFQDDRTRSNTLQLNGKIVLRYTYTDVMDHRDQIVEDVRAAVWRAREASQPRIVPAPADSAHGTHRDTPTDGAADDLATGVSG